MSPEPHIAWRQSTLRIIRVHPPYGAPYDQHTVRRAPAHDPVRARAVVAGLPTVATVAEELGPVLRRHTGHPQDIGDLDHVTVGCWGDVVQICDPAFGEDGILSTNLDDAFDAQVEAHPEARITAVCEMYSFESYGKYLAHVPGQPRLSADGWHDQYVTGDPAQLLRAVGVDPRTSGVEYLDTGEDDPFVGTEYLDLLARGLHSVYSKENLAVSVFRVTRTEDVRDSLADVWLRKD
ncbi:DUF6333 family protein [Streptomyces sp. HB2AG]|uniref:DUF6333 family protein n=1 Tax=Streptomyces sp. HB2AG TaxID=2983400 RepID=UPI0022AA7791|nr:DUF6333 family protein [Streptomyces sp. HB2AG]MCZ2524117.1 DUF6333 family protein [Streptomyces sp. HB2AG]